jgi:proteic killer suppression protein
MLTLIFPPPARIALTSLPLGPTAPPHLFICCSCFFEYGEKNRRPHDPGSAELFYRKKILISRDEETYPGVGNASRRAKLIFTLDIINAPRYYRPMIVSFRSSETAALAEGRRVKRYEAIELVARRKLRQLEIAGCLADLRIPPGNRLESLKGDRIGQHSIRINDQYRVCFRWMEAGAEDVEIVDYH